jgi:hypothetical protein
MVGLSNRMENKFRVFEVGLSTLVRTMDKMEATFLHLRDPRLDQRSTFDSINLRRPIPKDDVAGNNHGNSDRGTTPTNIEEEPLNLSQASEIKYFASNMS